MKSGLLKIGQLAKLTGVLPSTIHYYTSEGLLLATERSPGGYRLYAAASVQRVKRIQRLQGVRRLTLQEIRQQLGGQRWHRP